MTDKPHQCLRTMTVLEVTDILRSVAFYKDKLGFSGSLWGEPEVGFAIMQRGTISIALDASRNGTAPNNQHWAAYNYVTDVDKLHAEFREHEVPMRNEPEDRFYGCRDFDVIDPDGYVLAFGQALNIDPDDLGPGLGPDYSRDGDPAVRAAKKASTS